MPLPPRIFISDSDEGAKWLDRLQETPAPLIRDGHIKPCDDPGGEYLAETDGR